MERHVNYLAVSAGSHLQSSFTVNLCLLEVSYLIFDRKINWKSVQKALTRPLATFHDCVKLSMMERLAMQTTVIISLVVR
jgi:hypothetical protein